MSIISCTSPSPSAMILPASSVTRRPKSCLASRKALPSWRMISPRLGAGTVCHFWKAFCARWAVRSYSSGVAVRTLAKTLPSIGETLSSTLPLPSHSPQNAPGLVSFMPSFFRTDLDFDFITSVFFLNYRRQLYQSHLISPRQDGRISIFEQPAISEQHSPSPQPSPSGRGCHVRYFERDRR